MSYEPDRIARIWRGMLERKPEWQAVLKDSGTFVDYSANPEVGFLRAFDILIDNEKELKFQASLQRKSRRVTPRKRDGIPLEPDERPFDFS